MSTYYKESVKKATLKYNNDKIAHIQMYYQTDQYQEDTLPAIKKSGLPAATFVKQAVIEQLLEDNLLSDADRDALVAAGLLPREEDPSPGEDCAPEADS